MTKSKAPALIFTAAFTLTLCAAFFLRAQKQKPSTPEESMPAALLNKNQVYAFETETPPAETSDVNEKKDWKYTNRLSYEKSPY